MKTFIKNLQIVSLLLVVLVVVVSCKDDEDKTPAGWTDAQIAEAITDCSTGTDADGTKEQCTCFVNDMASKYTYAQLFDDEIELDDATALKIFADFIVAGDKCGIEITLDDDEEVVVEE